MKSKKAASKKASQPSAAASKDLYKKLEDIVDICRLEREQRLDEFLKGSPDDPYLKDFLMIKQKLGDKFDAALKSAIAAMPEIRQKAHDDWLFREREPGEDEEDYQNRVAEQQHSQRPY